MVFNKLYGKLNWNGPFFKDLVVLILFVILETTDKKMELEKKLNEIREFLKISIRNSNGSCYDEIETSCIDPALEQKVGFKIIIS